MCLSPKTFIKEKVKIEHEMEVNQSDKDLTDNIKLKFHDDAVNESSTSNGIPLNDIILKKSILMSFLISYISFKHI